MKKLLSVLLSILMLTAICSEGFGVSAYYFGLKLKSSDGFYYHLMNDKYAEILGYDEFTADGEIHTFEIPAEVDSYKVVSIGESAFGYWEDLSPKKIIIPDTVTHIGDTAFSADPYDIFNVSTITEFVIPSSVTYIGVSAFRGNHKVESIEIPESVVYIGKGAFDTCLGLKELEIPGTVRYLGENVFSNCEKLEKVTINKGFCELPEKAFYNCPNLKSITVYGDILLRDKSVGYLYNSKTKKETINKNVKINIIESLKTLLTAYPYRYAQKTGLKCELNLLKTDSKRLECPAGEAIKLKVKDEILTDWSSSNRKVVSINKNGKLFTLSKGTATITAKLSDGTEYSRKIKVTSSPKLYLISRDEKGTAYFNKAIKEITLKKGQEKEIGVKDKVAGIKNAYSNTNIAKFTGNRKNNILKVKALKKGTTTLRIKVNGVIVLSLKVKVK